MRNWLRAVLISAVVLAGGCRSQRLPTKVVTTGPMPANTVMLSAMMRELSAKHGSTEAFLKQIEGNQKQGALMTPALVDKLRTKIVGKDWDGLDRFPGWTMGEINPTVRVVGHYAGKNKAVEGTATAGGAPAAGAASFLDLGPYAAVDGVSETIDLTGPSRLPGFDEKALVAPVGDGVTRGDGPSELAGAHSESQRLADVLNRLAANGLAGVKPVSARWSVGATVSSPEALIAAIAASGQTVTVVDSRYFANFGHLHFKGQDVMMPFWVNSQIFVPGTGRPLLVPVSHAEYEWHIAGPRMKADVSFYFGIDGKAEFRTMDQLDQGWAQNRLAHTYTGADAVEVTRLSGELVRAYMRLHAAHPAMPFGGYYAFGVCQDAVAAVELKMTGKTTLFPNTADAIFFTDPADAEVNELIRRIPKDRDGKEPEAERIFGSLPVADTDTELAKVSIPGLGADLVATHDAWSQGNLEHQQTGWRARKGFIWVGAVIFFVVVAAWWRRRQGSGRQG